MYETVLADLRSRGYTVTHGDDAAEPPALAADGDAPAGLGDDPVAVEPVGTDPTELVERAAGAARHDRAVLYVAAPEDAEAVREVVAAPRFVASARDGLRVFHHVPDRIRLPDDTYAAVRATPPTPRYGESARASADRVLVWREEPGDDGEPARLVLEVNRRVTASLDPVERLTCLDSTDAFPYRYARRDGSFRVLTGDREVGRFPGVAAMRSGGYLPVPVPLVPEHHLRWGTPAMGLAVVEGERVGYEAL